MSLKIKKVASPENISQETLDLLNEFDQNWFNDGRITDKIGAHWWIAYVDDEPAGFAGMSVDKKSKQAFLCLVAVAPSFRRRGIHKRLIRHRVKYARRLNLKRVVTYTAKNNFISANNMLSCGFKLYGPRCKYGFKDGLYFKKDL